MTHVVAFLLLAAGSLLLALTTRGAAWLALWPALSFTLVAVAYLGLGPRVFGKRPDGTLSPLSTLLLLPYLALLRALWRALRLLRTEAAWHELVPGVLVGRRLLEHEAPHGLACVVDLTCELEEPPAMSAAPAYLNVPTLDGTPPDGDALVSLVEHLGRVSGTAYVHCAEGHGRAGTVAVALLLARGLADDVDEAIALAKRLRPGIRLRPAQRARVLEVQARLRPR